MLYNSDVPSDGTTTQLIIIVLLILVNAFLAASELAILSANPHKIAMLADKGNKRAKLVLKLKENETKFLSTIQVGITLAGFFSSATAAVSLSEGFGSLLTNIGIPFGADIALVVVTLILSYFTLVFGELFPKRIALRSPEKIAMAFARIVNVIRIVFKPIVFVLSGSCEILVRLFRLKPKEEEKVTSDEIMALVNIGVTDGTIDEGEKDLIDNVFIFDDLTVKDVMIPRADIVMIDINDDFNNIIKLIKEEQYTRIPVYAESEDNILGVLNIKDIVLLLDFGKIEMKDLLSILRKPHFVSESMKADKLFKELQKNKEHSAIVIDETGSLAGYVTMEDLIEEIFGNIYDEHDEVITHVNVVDEYTYILDGSISIYELNRELGLEIEKETDAYNTLAGMITYRLQQIPNEGDAIYLEEYHLTLKVLEVVQNRIMKIELTMDKEENDETM